MRARDEGLRSEALREALALALAGKVDRLEDLLCRHGGGADPRPNLRLAAAFGAEIGARGAGAERLLTRLAADDADPETPRVFLPIAAAYGWAALLADDEVAARAWEALGALAADERSPVRLAVIDAVRAFSLGAGGALALVAAADEWLAMTELEARRSAAAVAVEILRERRLLAALAARAELPGYLGRVVEEVAAAPRSAQRLDSRRRLVVALPPTLALVVGTLGGAGRPGGVSWFEELCATAAHPDVRSVLSDTIIGLRSEAIGASPVLIEHLRALMGGSAKPLRDPSRLRPGTGRGKASRALR